MRKLTVLVLVVLMATWGMGNAQDNEDLGSDILHPRKKLGTKSDSEKKPLPIEIQQSGTDKKPAQDYYYNGTRLQSFEQFKIVIDPLNDPETNRLLQDSANKESEGMVFIVGGGLMFAGGFIYALAASVAKTSNGPFAPVQITDLTPYWVLGCSGGLVALIGAILKGDAGQCRRDAVMRYNHLVEQDQNLSMILLSPTGLPGLELTKRF
jgi:hypothetical protein